MGCLTACVAVTFTMIKRISSNSFKKKHTLEFMTLMCYWSSFNLLDSSFCTSVTTSFCFLAMVILPLVIFWWVFIGNSVDFYIVYVESGTFWLWTSANGSFEMLLVYLFTENLLFKALVFSFVRLAFSWFHWCLLYIISLSHSPCFSLLLFDADAIFWLLWLFVGTY